MNTNGFPSVFIDNDKPEIVHGLDVCGCEQKSLQPPPPPPKYSRKNPVINRPYSDKPKPGPFRPDYTTTPVENRVPNPVPNTYLAPGHKYNPAKPCEHPDRNMIPMEWEEDKQYVTKQELNRILRTIADADIFNDLSENGTTVSVGGISKGTKFCHLTLAKLVEYMLYPTSVVDDEDYVCETADGKTILNSTVKYPIGEFQEGDSLKGLTIAQIIEKMLCGTNNWGTYVWLSEPIAIDPSTTTIDAEEVIPELVSDYNKYRTFELHVVGGEANENFPFIEEEDYIYDEIIAQMDTDQTTNVTTAGVPSDIKWSYNPDTKKITLHTATDITQPVLLIMVRR